MDNYAIDFNGGKRQESTMNYIITGGAGLDIIPVFEKQKEGNVMTSQADISLAKKLLDWKPQTTLEDWIKNLYKS